MKYTTNLLYVNQGDRCYTSKDNLLMSESYDTRPSRSRRKKKSERGPLVFYLRKEKQYVSENKSAPNLLRYSNSSKMKQNRSQSGSRKSLKLTHKNLNNIFGSRNRVKWLIYRCQTNVKEESCCCQCNSDAMFEVMKGLYDCYKKKDCTNCKCVLCMHGPMPNKYEAQLRKLNIPEEKIQKAKADGLLTLAGKTPEEKEASLKRLAEMGLPLPEGKTASEKKLIDKVRAEVGLPSLPKGSSAKAKYDKAIAEGLISPLDDKTPDQKEQTLKRQFEAGLPLPKGRTPSEKALINKIKKGLRKPSSMPKRPSDRLKKAKEAGLLTPLAGKPADQKEKILRGLAEHGLPFPKERTASDQKLINKIRGELGLPPEPKTIDDKEKYDKALADGTIVPLEGKTPAQKEKILKKLAKAGIPLPEGRTPSEKALIAKVKVATKATSTPKIASDKLLKAQQAGLITPLKGKTPEQKEKILRGLAEHGIPLPEGKSASDKKIIAKVRRDLGLPPEPKSLASRIKQNKAISSGLVAPLDNKTPEEKEKILKHMVEEGIALPEGRTPSEKALIAKVKASTLPTISPEKLKKAQAAGLITPLEGKTPAQKEKILKGLAQYGIPLPEGKTASEKKLIDKVRRDMGLPPEPKSSAERLKYNKAMATGIITPLEGKKPADKEKALTRMAEAGIPLPEGRTPSEKALIAKVKATTKPISEVQIPAEKMKKAQAEGFITPLAGKTPAQKEKILRGLAQNGIPLPEGKTPSEKKLIAKVRKDLGLPPEPKSRESRMKQDKAVASGIVTPLEGKTPAEKEKALRRMAEAGIPLPEGRTPSEKALIAKVKASAGLKIPSEKLRKAQAAGLLTPLTGKKPAQKEKILRGLAQNGIPLPEGKTPSEKKLIAKVRKDLGLPPDPTSRESRMKHDKAVASGIVTPLEGKTPAEKEKALIRMAEAGIPLPEGRTPSEKALIAKVKATTKPISEVKISPEKMKKAQAEGFITPLAGKTPAQKEKILRGLAQNGIPLPEGKTPSEKKLIAKVRKDLGLPPDPTSRESRTKHDKAVASGIVTPLEGKTPAEKEKALRRMAEAGIPLPEGRTPSEKALIAKVKATTKPTSAVKIPSEKMRKAQAAGFITPLAGKTPEQKEKILRGLAQNGIPLPEGKTPSEKKLIAKVRKDLGLPPEPTSRESRMKHDKAVASGIVTPLEGKTPAEKEKTLRRMAEAGIPLPEGRTPSEKALIAKVKASPILRIPSEKLRKAQAAGLLTPLAGKTPEQKEKILRGLAQNGIPLPEGQTPSEKKLIAKVRQDLGLPRDPTTQDSRVRHDDAVATGVITPLEGKTPKEKEKILRRMAEASLPLPEGRTPSEKALIDKVKATTKSISAPKIPSEKLRKAQAAGFITPLAGKTPEQKEKILRGLAMNGIPLPEGKTPSEKQLIAKVRKDLGLPPEPKTKVSKIKQDKAITSGLITPLEGKTPAEKEKALRRMAEAGIPLPEGRTSSERELIDKVKATTRPISAVKIPSEKLRKAQAEGFLTPLEGKTPEQKEKILKGLAMNGIPLPEGKTPSEKKLIAKVRRDLGLPPEPKSRQSRMEHDKAVASGLITPLEGKTPADKERALKRMAEAGIPLPEGRTPSEKALISKVKAAAGAAVKIPSDKLKKAQAAGLLTPLTGKTPEQKENILRGLAMNGIPLPEGQTPSEKALIAKVRKDLGLPPEPTSAKSRAKHDEAVASGLITPLEGKTPAQKEKVLRGMAEAGLPLPEGRTPSEKDLIAQVKATTKPLSVVKIPSEKMRKAQAAGFITPLTGKTPEQKDKILRGLAMNGIPLPKGKTPSEMAAIDKVRKELGLPPEPTSRASRLKHDKAVASGLITPLEGKTRAEKEKVLRKLADAGIPLPEGRTPSEKDIISKIHADKKKAREQKISELDLKSAKEMIEGKGPSDECICDLLYTKPLSPSEMLKKAKAEGLLTPLEGKSPERKEKIIKGLAMRGLPLPEGKTESDKRLIDKVRRDLGLPPPPKTPKAKAKYDQAVKDGLMLPLEGKSPAQKEKILRGLADAGIPLPVGRTPSEKALIAKVDALTKRPEYAKAKADGLFTPLEGKTPEQKEKILRGLAMQGFPLPEGKTASDKKLIKKVRADLGLPPGPKSSKSKAKYDQATNAGLVRPLEGKSTPEKEKILRDLMDAGIPLPEGRTPSEKELVKKIKDAYAKAKAAGLLTPLEGKTPLQKENILRGLAMNGLPLPKGKTPSEKKMIDKVRGELGLPPEPKSAKSVAKYNKALTDGLIVPLEGKSTPEKEKILRGLVDAGVPLPEGRTPSEKALVAKVKAESRRPPSTEALLEGKSPAEKEAMLRDLASQGLPLPKPKSASDKKLIEKVTRDLGIPLEPQTSRSKKKFKSALAKGLIIPLEGKTPAEKEQILRNLAEAGAPLPEPRTDSERALINKIKAEYPGRGLEQAEVAEIQKTTTCERGCGCDNKKIKFKHSYVRIKVTSPDLSNICSCPTDCLGQVLQDAHVDKDGIKITVGRVMGVPSFSSAMNTSYQSFSRFTERYNASSDDISYTTYRNSVSSFYYDTDDSHSNILLTSEDLQIVHDQVKKYVLEELYGSNYFSNSYYDNTATNRKDNIYETDSQLSRSSYKSKYIIECLGTPSATSIISILKSHDLLSTSSIQSVEIEETDTTLSLSSSSLNTSVETSVISLQSNSTPTSTQYIYYPETISSQSLEVNNSECFTNEIDYNLVDSCNVSDTNASVLSNTKHRRETINNNDDVTKLKMSPSNNNKNKQVLIVNNLKISQNLLRIVDEVMLNEDISKTSSIFVLVPTSDDNGCESVSESAISSRTSNKRNANDSLDKSDKGTNLDAADAKVDKPFNSQIPVSVCIPTHCNYKNMHHKPPCSCGGTPSDTNMFSKCCKLSSPWYCGDLHCDNHHREEYEPNYHTMCPVTSNSKLDPYSSLNTCDHGRHYCQKTTKPYSLMTGRHKDRLSRDEEMTLKYRITASTPSSLSIANDNNAKHNSKGQVVNLASYPSLEKCDEVGTVTITPPSRNVKSAHQDEPASDECVQFYDRRGGVGDPNPRNNVRPVEVLERCEHVRNVTTTADYGLQDDMYYDSDKQGIFKNIKTFASNSKTKLRESCQKVFNKLNKNKSKGIMIKRSEIINDTKVYPQQGMPENLKTYDSNLKSSRKEIDTSRYGTSDSDTKIVEAVETTTSNDSVNTKSTKNNLPKIDCTCNKKKEEEETCSCQPNSEKRNLPCSQPGTMSKGYTLHKNTLDSNYKNTYHQDNNGNPHSYLGMPNISSFRDPHKSYGKQSNMRSHINDNHDELFDGQDQDSDSQTRDTLDDYMQSTTPRGLSRPNNDNDVPHEYDRSYDANSRDFRFKRGQSFKNKSSNYESNYDSYKRKYYNNDRVNDSSSDNNFGPNYVHPPNDNYDRQRHEKNNYGRHSPESQQRSDRNSNQKRSPPPPCLPTPRPRVRTRPSNLSQPQFSYNNIPVPYPRPELYTNPNLYFGTPTSSFYEVTQRKTEIPRDMPPIDPRQWQQDPRAPYMPQQDPRAPYMQQDPRSPYMQQDPRASYLPQQDPRAVYLPQQDPRVPYLPQDPHANYSQPPPVAPHYPPPNYGANPRYPYPGYNTAVPPPYVDYPSQPVCPCRSVRSVTSSASAPLMKTKSACYCSDDRGLVCECPSNLKLNKKGQSKGIQLSVLPHDFKTAETEFDKHLIRIKVANKASDPPTSDSEGDIGRVLTDVSCQCYIQYVRDKPSKEYNERKYNESDKKQYFYKERQYIPSSHRESVTAFTGGAGYIINIKSPYMMVSEDSSIQERSKPSEKNALQNENTEVNYCNDEILEKELIDGAVNPRGFKIYLKAKSHNGKDIGSYRQFMHREN